MNTVKLEEVRIAWVDVESTGLSPHEGEKLLQVACIFTDGNMEEVSEEFMEKIYYSEEDAAAMREDASPYVRDMHDATDLWSTLPAEGKPLEEVDQALAQFIARHSNPEELPRLGGNSISLDRDFLKFFTPTAYAKLHYRSLDMTSVGMFIRLNRPEVGDFVKKTVHDALDDIRESIAEARYYRDAISTLVLPF